MTKKCCVERDLVVAEMKSPEPAQEDFYQEEFHQEAADEGEPDAAERSGEDAIEGEPDVEGDNQVSNEQSSPVT